MSILSQSKKILVFVIFCIVSVTVFADPILNSDVVSTLSEKKVFYARLYDTMLTEKLHLMDNEKLMVKISDTLREVASPEARKPSSLASELAGSLGKALYASESIVLAPYDGLLLEVEVSPGFKYVDLTDPRVLDYFKNLAGSYKIEDIYRFINNIESEIAFRVAPIASAPDVSVNLENTEWVLRSTEKLSVSVFSLEDKSVAELRVLLRSVFNELYRSSNDGEDKVVSFIKGLIRLSRGFSDIMQLIRVFYASPDYWKTLNPVSQDRVMQALVKRGVTSVQSGASLFRAAHSGTSSDTTESAKKSKFTLDVNTFPESQLLMILGEAVRYIDSVEAGIFLLRHIRFAGSMSEYMQNMRNKIVNQTVTRIESVEDAVALLKYLKKVSPRYYNVKQVPVVDAAYPYVRSEQDREKMNSGLSQPYREYLEIRISSRDEKCSATFK